MARSFWIALHQGVHEDEKTLALADAFEIDPHTVVGHLTRLWLSVMVHRGHDDISGLTPRVIAAWSGWTSDPQRWLDELIAAGWLKTNRGKVTVSGWDECNGAQLRELERKRAWRRRSRDATETDAGRDESVSTTADRTVPNRTVPEEEEDGVTAVFPLRTRGKFWKLTSEHCDKLQERFPEVDVRMEVKEAVSWCWENPTKRKTENGMPRFLSGWMKGAKKDAKKGNGKRAEMGVSEMWGQENRPPTKADEERVRKHLEAVERAKARREA